MTSFSRGTIPLREALENIERVSETEDYVSDEGRIASSDLSKAKNYILDLYSGIDAVHSFRNERNFIFDSVPFEQQPGVRGLADKNIPVAPDLRSDEGAIEISQAGQRVGQQIRDELGNQVLPPFGTVAIKRITLDNISKYGTVDSFLSKGGSIPASIDTVGPDGLYHRHVVANQNADVYGGSGKFSIHKTAVSAELRQGFSLTQMWLVSGSYETTLQTIEPAITTQPLQYGNDPALVIYFTNDGYKPGSASFNHEGGDFIQTGNKWLLGSPLSPVSVVDGNQYYLQITVKLDAGKWWIYLGGEASENAIGYYPTTLFSKVTSNGLAVKAGAFQVGGETIVQPIEPAVFAAIGSGQLASAGWKKSAYVRDLKYYNSTGSAVTANMSLYPAAPRYSIQRNRYAAPWNETVWYGGPGGT